MKRGLQLAALCLLATFAASVVAALEFPLLDDLGPGPGFFPFWLGLAGAALAIVLFLEVTRAPEEAGAAPILPDREGRARGLAVLFFLVAAAALFDPLGFRLTMLLFLGGMLVALGIRSPVGVVLTAVLGSFGVFHVFYYWLKVPLPIGQFGI